MESRLADRDKRNDGIPGGFWKRAKRTVMHSLDGSGKKKTGRTDNITLQDEDFESFGFSSSKQKSYLPRCDGMPGLPITSSIRDISPIRRPISHSSEIVMQPRTFLEKQRQDSSTTEGLNVSELMDIKSKISKELAAVDKEQKLILDNIGQADDVVHAMQQTGASALTEANDKLSQAMDQLDLLEDIAICLPRKKEEMTMVEANAYAYIRIITKRLQTIIDDSMEQLTDLEDNEELWDNEVNETLSKFSD